MSVKELNILCPRPALHIRVVCFATCSGQCPRCFAPFPQLRHRPDVQHDLWLPFVRSAIRRYRSLPEERMRLPTGCRRSASLPRHRPVAADRLCLLDRGDDLAMIRANHHTIVRILHLNLGRTGVERHRASDHRRGLHRRLSTSSGSLCSATGRHRAPHCPMRRH